MSVQGDTSILNSERKHHFSEDERAEGVASIRTVDQVILLGAGTLLKLVKVLNPAVLVLGKEFESEQDNQVSKALYQLKKQGGKILFHAGETHYASADLLRDNLPNLHDQNIKQYKCIWCLGKDDVSFRFINDNKPTSLTKLIILKCISYVVKSGMNLIGVNTPNKM